MVKPQARELSPALGAEILGVEPGTRLDDGTIRFLREVFDDRGLLLLRDANIDRACQFYLSEILRGHAPPTEEECLAGAAQQSKFMISNKEPEAAAPFGRLLFHCDGMWSDMPFEVLSLHAVDVQPPVIPTLFASSVYGWDTLPEGLRARVEKLHAVHVTGPEHIHERRRREFQGELSQPKRDHMPTSTMPVVHQHPRTGRTMLYVTQGMTKEIVELPSDASEDLLEELFAHLYRAESVYAHEWRNGDIILWDNLTVQHARPEVKVEGPTRTFRKIGLPVPTDVKAHLVQSYQNVS